MIFAKQWLFDEVLHRPVESAARSGHSPSKKNPAQGRASLIQLCSG
jgi:hypothetical protein